MWEKGGDRGVLHKVGVRSGQAGTIVAVVVVVGGFEVERVVHIVARRSPVGTEARPDGFLPEECDRYHKNADRKGMSFGSTFFADILDSRCSPTTGYLSQSISPSLSVALLIASASWKLGRTIDRVARKR